MTLSPSVPSVDDPVATGALARAASRVRPALDAAVERLAPEIRVPVRHHLSAGGKNVRAALALLGAEACGVGPHHGLQGAVAIELVHNFSLLHDDIIDGDHERRHQPTVWAKFGVGPALIAGDALVVLALEVLLDEPTPAKVAAARRLTGATQAMIAGQADDMAFESRRSVEVEECLTMEAGKTGALLSCAAALGAEVGGAPPEALEALSAFGTHLGIAFQAVDDVLGIWGKPERTGKPVGADLLAHKKTLPVVLALEHSGPDRDQLAQLLCGHLSPHDVALATYLMEEAGARREALALAEDHLADALSALAQAELAPGPCAELAAIAHFVTGRDR